jgi:branched-subunit amino acid ABC-type transport system permease component
MSRICEDLDEIETAILGAGLGAVGGAIIGGLIAKGTETVLPYTVGTLSGTIIGGICGYYGCGVK